jgi:hypothetical protein
MSSWLCMKNRIHNHSNGIPHDGDEITDDQYWDRQLTYSRFVFLASMLKRVPLPEDVARDPKLKAGIGPDKHWKSISDLAKASLYYHTIKPSWYDDYIAEVYSRLDGKLSEQARSFEHRDIEAWKVFEIFFFRQFEASPDYRIIRIDGIYRPWVVAFDLNNCRVVHIQFVDVLQKHSTQTQGGIPLVFVCRTIEWMDCPHEVVEL